MTQRRTRRVSADVEADSGTELWHTQIGGIVVGAYVDRKLVAVSNDGTAGVAKVFALDPDSGAPLWSYAAPARTGCSPSIVNGRVLWGYGFTLFGPPGDGGVISFTLGK